MRSPRDFFRPLAAGAPEPMMRIDATASRMIHFFDPSNARMVDKLPGLANKVDVLLGNLEDAVDIDRKEAARRGLVEVARSGRLTGVPLWARVNALDSPWILDDLTDLITEAGEQIDVIMPILVGVVFAVLNFFLFRLSVFVAVFFVTSSVVSSLLLNYVQLDELIGFVIALAAGLIFAILAVIFLKPVIIVTTGLMGGLLFADQIFSYLIQVRWNAQTETLVRLGTGLILGVIGIICQFVSTRKD